VDGMFPLLALSISALFNFLMLAWTFSFLRDKFANVEDYIADMKILAAAMAFFIGWFLTYFFEAGHRANACRQEKSDVGSTGASSPK